MKNFFQNRYAESIFKLTLGIKVFNGLVELASGLCLLLLKTLPRSFNHFSASTEHFAAISLITYGVVNLLLVIALWRNKLWSYPASLLILIAFTLYSIYRFTHTHSLPLLGFITIDLFTIWLLWQRYNHKRVLYLE